ncbi:hypothetical protein JW998_03355 [candidate division KSB1 bacterium]|nr:hypothetical protein [candidate division KSB1 bacterium]
MRVIATMFALLACSSMRAATVTGVLINATRDSSVVPAATIHLLAMTAQSNFPAFIAATTTNNRGEFRFNIAGVESSATYFAAVDHEEVRYFSEGVDLSAKGAVDISLAVYDSTHSTADVHALMHHLIIEDLGDRVKFREIRVLHNPKGKTITHAFVDEQMGAALFQFLLPAGAINFASQSGSELTQHLNYALDRGVFLPGSKTVSYAYEIAMPQKSLDVAIHATHAAQTVDLFIRGDNLVIESQQLIDKGMFDIRGALHHRYGAADIDAGATIRFRMQRVGRASNAPSPAPAIIVTSVFLVLATAVSILRRKKTAPREPSAGRQQSKSRTKK